MYPVLAGTWAGLTALVGRHAARLAAMSLIRSAFTRYAIRRAAAQAATAAITPSAQLSLQLGGGPARMAVSRRLGAAFNSMLAAVGSKMTRLAVQGVIIIVVLRFLAYWMESAQTKRDLLELPPLTEEQEEALITDGQVVLIALLRAHPMRVGEDPEAYGDRLSAVHAMGESTPMRRR